MLMAGYVHIKAFYVNKRFNFNVESYCFDVVKCKLLMFTGWIYYYVLLFYD